MARSIKEVHTINYYPINEGAARRAKEMNSFSDYKEGSATAEYRAMVDKAAAIAEKQKSRVDPMYHEKIDHLLDTYARKLAENMNQGFAIDARVPSVLIAGPSNFPVGKKEKQNRARDSNMEEWRHIQGLLDKIRQFARYGEHSNHGYFVDPWHIGNTVCLQTAFGRRWRRLRLLSAVVVGLRTLALLPMHAHRGQAFQGVTPSFHLSNYQLSKQRYFVVCPLTFYRQRTSRTFPEGVAAF